MRVRRNPWRSVRKAVLLLAVALVIVGGVIAGALYIFRDRNPIPEELRSSLTFSPLVIPSQTEGFETSNYQFSTAENNVQILSYIITVDGRAVTVSQYPKPQAFDEVDQYQEQFLSNVVQQSDTVQTAIGAIAIGSLAKQEGSQVGVILENGLIVFLNPDEPIDNSLWRRIGDRLVLQRST